MSTIDTWAALHSGVYMLGEAGGSCIKNEAFHAYPRTYGSDYVLGDGTKGLRIASEDALLLIGRVRASNEIFGNTAEFASLLVKDASGKVVLDQNALAK